MLESFHYFVFKHKSFQTWKETFSIKVPCFQKVVSGFFLWKMLGTWHEPVGT